MARKKTRRQRITEIMMQAVGARKKAKKMSKPSSIAKETIKGMPAAAKRMPGIAKKTGKKVANYARYLAGGREYGLKQNMRTPDGRKYVERHFPKDYKRLLKELGLNK